MITPRKKLPHGTPLFVCPEQSLYFITLCSDHRGSRELLEHDRAKVILDAAVHRHERGIWFARIFLIMPDHIHTLLRFPNPDHPMRKAILDFKRWTARTGGFHWQEDFFDHRLRQEESAQEKADYVLMKTVRAGLVDNAEDWPHRFIAGDDLG